jgi:hypothetical protein
MNLRNSGVSSSLRLSKCLRSCNLYSFSWPIPNR